MKVYTIGFTQKAAREFFSLLKEQDIARVVDVRLSNVSQLAGFAKKSDLKFFLKEICNIEYVHLPELAPTKEILDAYKKHNGSWDVYEQEFLDLISKRGIENTLPKEILDKGCLLCSERQPHHCHRRLVIDYLKGKWSEPLEVRHL